MGISKISRGYSRTEWRISRVTMVPKAAWVCVVLVAFAPSWTLASNTSDNTQCVDDEECSQSPVFVQKKQLYEAKVLAAKALATQLEEEVEKGKKEQYNKSNGLESVGGKCYHHADCNDADCPGWCGPFHAFQEINCCSYANTCGCECSVCKEVPIPVSALEGKRDKNGQSPAFVQKKQLYEAATQLAEEVEKGKTEQYKKSNGLESVGGECYP